MSQKPFLTGNKIKLRKLTDADFEKFKEIEGNMENRLLMEDDIPFPPTDENHRSFIDQISANKEEYTFAIEKLDTTEFIGTIGLFRFNWKNGTCYVGIAIHQDQQNKGYGTDAMQTLVDFIFTNLNLNKVKLDVFSFNPGAIRSYQKCGFKTEGILRDEIFRFGQFHDVHAMGILRREWLTQQ